MQQRQAAGSERKPAQHDIPGNVRGGVATATDKHAMATCIFSEAHYQRDHELEAYQRDDCCTGAGQRDDVEVVG